MRIPPVAAMSPAQYEQATAENANGLESTQLGQIGRTVDARVKHAHDAYILNSAICRHDGSDSKIFKSKQKRHARA
jgi:hypothetical protein